MGHLMFHVGGFLQLKQKSSFSPVHHRNADRTVKYKTWSSWKSIPQQSVSQAFLDTSPSQTYSTLHLVSSHLSTSETRGAHCWGKCHGGTLHGSCWRSYYVVGCRSLGQSHIRGWDRTTSLRSCEKHSSQRDHQEPGGNTSQTNMKDHMSFQPTGIRFFIA